MDEASPLGIFLVDSGTRGNKLLFKYPFMPPNDSVQKEPAFSPYAVQINEDVLSNSRGPHVNGEVSLDNYVIIPDDVLQHLFACKTELCNNKFELKVNNVRFVGHPMLLAPTPGELTVSRREPSVVSSPASSSLIMFNVVFALQALANYETVGFYHELSLKMSVALRAEERRCGYVTAQSKIMRHVLEDLAESESASSGSPYAKILERSQLAQDLEKAYTELRLSGAIHLRINRWLDVSFCLPPKAHRLAHTRSTVSIAQLEKCLVNLRPYHALLLVSEPHEILQCLPPDASVPLERVIRYASVTKNLTELSYDAGITPGHVMQVAAHLVYWAKAIIVYPLCETNVYVVAPNAPTRINSALMENFLERFPGVSLSSILSDFSVPTSLSELQHPSAQRSSEVEQHRILVWALQQRILMQVHTYVYLMPPGIPTVVTGINESPKTNRTSMSDFAGSSFQSDDLSLMAVGSPVSVSSQSSSKCASDDESLPQGHHHMGLSGTLRELTAAQREAIKRVEAYNHEEDRQLFLRLCRYFDGRHHLEEIMYAATVKRSSLLELLDKFGDVLITVQHQDPTVDIFYR